MRTPYTNLQIGAYIVVGSYAVYWVITQVVTGWISIIGDILR